MKLFKRVIVSVFRRKTASLVLLLVTFLLGNVLAVSLTIEQSSLNLKEDLMHNIGGKLVLKDDVFDGNYVNFGSKEDYIKRMNAVYEVYTKLSSREYIEYADYSLHMNNIHLVNAEKYNLPIFTEENTVFSLFHGIQNEKLIDEMEGILSLVDGEKFTKGNMTRGDNVVLVSNKVLKNGQPIQVGDVIDVTVSFDVVNEENEYQNIESKPISYTVVGIFQPVENKFSDIQRYVYPFYVPNESIIHLQEMSLQLNENEGFEVMDTSRLWFYSAMMNVNSPEKLDELIFAAEVYLDKYGVLFDSTEDFVSQLIGPINTFADVAGNVVVFSVFAMTIIVGLISFYFIRDRKYEIGIYISLGIRKTHLVSQIILETLCVGLLGISLSIGSGMYISQKYSDYLFDTTIRISNEEKDKYTTGMVLLDPNNIKQEDVISQYEVEIVIQDMVNLVVIGIITLTGSSLFPLCYIMKLKPKNIMLD